MICKVSQNFRKQMKLIHYEVELPESDSWSHLRSNRKIPQLLVPHFLPIFQLLWSLIFCFVLFLSLPDKLCQNINKLTLKMWILTLNCFIALCSAKVMLLNNFCLFSAKFAPKIAFYKVDDFINLCLLRFKIASYIVTNDFGKIVKSFVECKKRYVLHVLQGQNICAHIFSNSGHTKIHPWSCSAKDGNFP